MISHHSIIFLPEKLNTWVSTAPYQLGEYLMYNLEQVLNTSNINQNTVLYNSEFNIEPSNFLYSNDFEKFNEFKALRKEIQKHIKKEIRIENEEEFIEKFISSNVEYYQGYVLVANYYYTLNDKQKALPYYKKALTKEFETTTTRAIVEERIVDIKKDL